MAKKKVKKRASARRKPARSGKDVRRLKTRVGHVERVTSAIVMEDVNQRASRIEAYFRIILFLAILGSILSLYLLWLHYRPPGQSFCSINEELDCVAVSKSTYSALLGVPVALIGFLGYTAFVVISVLLLTRDADDDQNLGVSRLNRIMMGLAAIGFLFSLYLSFVQEYLLGVWCVLCISSMIVVTAILVLVILANSKCLQCRRHLRKMGLDPENICKYC